MRIRGCCCSSR